MKDTQIKELLNGKDLNKAEDLKAISDAINNELNSTVAKKEGSFNEKLDALKKENESLKANADLSTKTQKELNEKLAKASETNSFLSKKAWVLKNVNASLDDEDMNDLFTLTNSRVSANKDVKWEDEVIKVANKRGFAKVDSKPAPAIPPAPQAKSFSTDEPHAKQKVTVDKDSWSSWMGKKY